MSLLIRTILALATLSLSNSSSVAQDVPGIPKVLLGEYTDIRDPCGEGIPVIFNSDNEFKTCAGHGANDGDGDCNYQVVNHRTTSNGYILKVKSRADEKQSELRVTSLKSGRLRLSLAGQSATVTGCHVERRDPFWMTNFTSESGPGAPAFLRGLFAKNAALCRSRHRKAGQHIFISKDRFNDYSTCGPAGACISSIRSYSRKVWGYSVTMVTHPEWKKEQSWPDHLQITKVGLNTFHFSGHELPTLSVVRCP